MTSQLHLPSFSIEGFRGIRSLEINDLGRVTLLAGKNGVGKTSVLEAIKIFASRGSPHTIFNLIDTREEVFSGEDEDGDMVLFPDFSSLFHNYIPDKNGMPSPIKINTTLNNPRSVSLSLVKETEEELADQTTAMEGMVFDGVHLNSILVSVDKNKRTLPIGPFGYYRGFRRLLPMTRTKSSRKPEEWPSSIALQSLGPGLPENDRVAELWDDVALTETEDFIINALSLATGPTLERLAVIGNIGTPFGPRNWKRRVVAKLKSVSHPVPLKRLGDGAQRLLGIALALANCQNGILLVDEIENGIHYSIMSKLWDMIFQAAHKRNVQVIAATHSWDCIYSFANVANKTDEVGALVRLEDTEDGPYPVHYSEDDLQAVADYGIEAR